MRWQIIIMGTSFSVNPFASTVVEATDLDKPILIINREKVYGQDVLQETFGKLCFIQGEFGDILDKLID